MQTFVPYADVNESASVLDNKRLNKQLLEGRQIYNIIAGNRTTGGWVRHPAVLMWRNYDMGLYSYLTAMRDECESRGISWEKNWLAIEDIHNNNWHRGDSVVMPPWIGDERIHQSHRNNLYRKDPEYYAEFVNDGFISCCPDCNYVWASHLLMYNDELLEVAS